MSFKISPSFSIAALATSTLLSACGGGGGGSTPSPTVPATVITASNYVAVAAQAWNSTEMLAPSGSGSNSGGGNSEVNVTAQMSDLYSGLNIAAQQLPNLEHTFADNCELGGNVQARFSLKTARSLSVGAKTSFSATQCVNRAVTLDGSMNLEVLAGNGRNLGVQFDRFTISTSKNKVHLNGDSLLSEVDGKVTVSGKNLTVAVFFDGQQLVDRTLQNYSFSGNDGLGNLQINGDLMLKNNTLGSLNVNLQTQQAFVRNSQGELQSGAMQISGGGSTLKLTAIGGGSARLDFSAKGDGNITATQTITFSQLRASK